MQQTNALNRRVLQTAIWRRGEQRVRPEDLRTTIRSRIITSLYAGMLHPGDRLPSVRRLGEELGEDPRAVLKAYRALEDEGLVEIRKRSGVYLAEQRQVAPEMHWETSEWVASDVLTEAWRRRIRIPELPEFIRRCTTRYPIRSACVDEVEDVRVSLCHELSEDFGLDAVPVLPGAEDDLRDVDLITCTTFQATALRGVAGRLGKPLVVASANRVALDQIARLGSPLLFVVVDRRFEPRLRVVFGEGTRVVTLDELGRVETGEHAVVYTRAAAMASGDPETDRLVPTVPVLSPETVRDLSHWIVRLNLEKAENAEAREGG